MAVRRSGNHVEVRTIEGFHSSCMTGTLNAFTMSGTFRRFGALEVRLNLLTKGESLRRYMKIANGSGSKTQWIKVPRAEYVKRLKVRTPWIRCPAATATPTTKYLKSSWYPGYVAVRFSDQNRQVQTVWQGDGPGFCFVGRRASQGVYAGTQYTFGVGAKRTSYRRDELLAGRHLSPPTWFRKSSQQAFARPQCQ
jgi:hypothetical protein